MNIYDKYPEAVTVDGEAYDLHTGYDRWLMALDAQDDTVLMPDDRTALQCRLLCKNPPRGLDKQARVVEAAFSILPTPEPSGGPRVIDMHQDAAMIRSAFFRIGIDLTVQKIHILQFLELLADLPSDTALMRTVELRMQPIPKATPHNGDYIAALMAAKARVAIKVPQEEQQALFARQLKQSTLLRG